MIEHQNDRSPSIERGVVVVVQLGRRDSIAGEDHRTGNSEVMREIPDRIRSVQRLLRPALFDCQRSSVAVSTVLDQRHGLQIGPV